MLPSRGQRAVSVVTENKRLTRLFSEKLATIRELIGSVNTIAIMRIYRTRTHFPHGIRHLKLSKRKDSDPLSGSGPTFWSGLRKDSDSVSDFAVSFNRSTVVSNPDDCISNWVS